MNYVVSVWRGFLFLFVIRLGCVVLLYFHIHTIIWIAQTTSFSFSLTDINECVRDRGLCTFGECVNLDGGFECRCPDGFLLTDDGKSCIGRCFCSFNLNPTNQKNRYGVYLMII